MAEGDNRLTVYVQDSSDYGGSSEFWIKWRGAAKDPEDALRQAFDGDTWRPRGGNHRTIDAVVVGPEIGCAEFEVRIHYPPSVIESIKDVQAPLREATRP